MNPAQHYAEAKGLDIAALAGAADFLKTGDAWSIVRWDDDTLGPRPSDQDLADVVAMPEPDPGVSVPDSPTLADWRVGLLLWQRLDDVTAKVASLVASTKPAEVVLGKIAQQQLEYSNNVSRDRLMAIHDAFGFTVDEVDESLWRAAQVAKGDLSGQWPLPKAA